MRTSFQTFSLIIVSILLLSTNGQQPTALIELCRHGARAPLNNTYDPSWPESELGMLTPVGMRQHYILGTILRSQYPTIFNTPNVTQIYILADNITRCVQSAISQSYGLWMDAGPGLGNGYPELMAIPPYDLIKAEVIALELSDSAALPNNFYPPPINTVDDQNVYILDSYGVCPEFEVLSKAQMEDSEAMEVWTLIQPTIDFINTYNTDPVVTYADFTAFADAFFPDFILNKPLPANISRTNIEAINNITWFYAWFFTHSYYGSPELLAIVAAPLFYEIFSMIDAVITGQSPVNFYFLSGHDVNVEAFMAAFNFINDSCIYSNFMALTTGNPLIYPLCYYPPFASTIKIEVYNTSTPYLKIKYNDVIVPICGSSGICPVDQFVQLAIAGISNYTTEDIVQICTQNSVGAKAKETMEAFVVNNTNTISWLQMALTMLFCISTIYCWGRNASLKRKYEEELERVRGIKMI